MRKVIVQTEMSLNGVLDGPNLQDLVFKCHNDAIYNDYLKGILYATDASLPLGVYSGGLDFDILKNLPHYA